MDRRRLRRRLAWVRAAVAGRFEAPPRKRRATQSRQARPEEALGRRQGGTLSMLRGGREGSRRLCRVRGGLWRGGGARGGGGTRGGGRGRATAQFSGGGAARRRGGSAAGGTLSLARPSHACIFTHVSGSRKAVAGGRSPVRAGLGLAGVARGSRRVVAERVALASLACLRPDTTVQSLFGAAKAGAARI